MLMAASLDRTFAALADPTRRAIVERLMVGEATVTEIAAPFPISLPAISRHLRVLEAASLVRQERDGAFRRCKLDPEGLQAASDWIAYHRRFWSESFEKLEAEMKSGQSKHPAKKGAKAHGKNRLRK
jgi:DNA-binding transcriptional ArsR family regulator